MDAGLIKAPLKLTITIVRPFIPSTSRPTSIGL